MMYSTKIGSLARASFMPVVLMLAMLVGVFATVPGCKPSSQGGVDGSITIAVIPKGTTHEFWKSIRAGAEKARRELAEQGVTVQIMWKGPVREDDREDQIKVVEDFITRGVDGIVLAPLDDRALRGPVEDASRAGIPVVIIDSDLASDSYISFVSTDNRAGGRLAGEALGKALGGKGKVVMLRYQEGSASTANREAGFLDAITKFPDIQLVSDNQYGGATTESAYRASENLLAPLKNADGSLQIDGIFCPNESTTFGMLRALQDAKLAGKVKFVGFDSSEKLVQGLRAGEIHALTLQNPMRMGYEGVMTLVAHLRGEKVERRLDTGVAMVTSENMNEPEMRDLLTPPLDQYLQ